MRTFVTRKDGGVATLLDARFGDAQGEAALARLKAFNPDIDLDKLAPGTRLLVPDAAAFRASVTTSAASEPLEELARLAAGSIAETGDALEIALKVRADERADIAAALKSAIVKRQADGDRQLAEQIDAARRTLAEEEADDKQAEADFRALGDAALGALAEMQKLLG